MPVARRLKPLRERQQVRSRETFEAILQAAAQVFERRGYAAATTNRIAERAGVSIGSLYQYFPNKAAILVALSERHLQQGIARLAPLIEFIRGRSATGARGSFDFDRGNGRAARRIAASTPSLV